MSKSPFLKLCYIIMIFPSERLENLQHRAKDLCSEFTGKMVEWN
jgi:hypothetical protein